MKLPGTKLDFLLNKLQLSLIDIGASGGIHPRWGESSQQSLRVMLFEPEDEARKELQANLGGNVTVRGVGLSSSAGTLPLYVAEKRMCSSVHPRNVEFVNRFPEAHRFDITHTTQIELSTLDDECKAADFDPVDFLKLDAEGHELDILKGASHTLEQLIGLESEVLFSPLYLEATTFAELTTFLTAHGLVLFDLQRYFWKRTGCDRLPSRGQLVIGNALYLQSPEQILARSDLDERRLKAAIRVYGTYGILDGVRILITAERARALLPENIIAEIESVLLELEEIEPQSFFAGACISVRQCSFQAAKQLAKPTGHVYAADLMVQS